MAVRQALARGLLTGRQLEHEADGQHRRPIIERARRGGAMRYASPAAFRAALDQRLKTEAEKTGVALARQRDASSGGSDLPRRGS